MKMKIKKFIKQLFPFILLITSLSACGEAVFFKHIKYDFGQSDKCNFIELTKKTANYLGYKICESDSDRPRYCNQKTRYWFEIEYLKPNKAELIFYHSFGSYPGPKNLAVEEFAHYIHEQCDSATIETKESSKWGFKEDNFQWIKMNF